MNKAARSEKGADPAASQPSHLAMLRRHIRQAENFERATVPLGVAAIDAHLPQGGLACGALHEVSPQDYRATPAAQGFLVALAAFLLSAREGPMLWSALRHDECNFGAAYAPGLRHIGLSPHRFIYARCTSVRDLLWSLEEGARQKGLGVVIGARPPKMTLTQSRRLQLAAGESGTPILLLRDAEDRGPSSSVTHWRVAPLPAARDSFGFLSSARWHVTLERARGGRPGTWAVEWDHVAYRFHIFSAVVDRTASEGARSAEGQAIRA